MASDNKGFTLEENLVLTNEELTSNWVKLASFIRSFEGGGWDEARVKALQLMKDEKAIDYIESVRKSVKGVVSSTNESKESKPTVKVEKLPKIPKSIYEKNYDKLMVIAPGLENMLENYNGEEIYGKSVKAGYMDFNLEILDHDKTGFYFAMSHYYEQNGDMVADPDMEILINVRLKTIEALHYQDARHYFTVYPDKRNRDIFSKHQKKDQNIFLGTWLKNLKNQGHKIKWDEGEKPDSTPPNPPIKPTVEAESVIVDKFKKSESEKVELKKVQPTEVKENVTSEPKDKIDELEQARIIPLNAGYTENERKEMFENFLRVVALNEKMGFKELASKALKVVNDSKAVPYLLSAWNKMKESDYKHLTMLNYFRLNSIIPNLLETLKNEGGSIRLVSDQTKTAFRITLGDDRKENVVILGIYQMKGKDPEPTLLVKINTETGAIVTDLSTNRFAGLKDFNADEPSRYFELEYESAIGFERWLKYITLKQFKPIFVNLRKVEDEPIIAFHPSEITEESEADEHDEFDNDYINKDIPDFEPGHVQLTETHKKYGVTQKVIDEINSTLSGKVILARAKAMIYNTKDKKADLSHQAKMPGFRISRTGKFYFEGRSNRADRTQSGY